MDKLKIAIVGNSPCILNHKFGEEIDSHDIVLRFNNFLTEGYEEYTGSKTTDICLAIIGIKDRNDEYYVNLKKLLSISKDHRYIRNNPNITFEIAFNNKLTINDVILSDESIQNDMKKKLSNPHDYSSGLMMIEYFLKKYPESIIDIYGFSFLKDKKIHLYDDIKCTWEYADLEEKYFYNFLNDKVNLHI